MVYDAWENIAITSHRLMRRVPDDYSVWTKVALSRSLGAMQWVRSWWIFFDCCLNKDLRFYALRERPRSFWFEARVTRTSRDEILRIAQTEACCIVWVQGGTGISCDLRDEREETKDHPICVSRLRLWPPNLINLK